MKDTSEIGKLGEDFACEHLKSKGYRIFDRNYRGKIGEIDIVAIDRYKTLVFVEVKTLQSGNSAIRLPDGQTTGLLPEDNLTKSKLKKLSRICEIFVSKNPELIREERGWRIDLVAVSLGENLKPKIQHYENIY